MSSVILIRGGGDLASGVALRLHRAGLRLFITELPQPRAVRRTVSFASAVYQGQVVVEGITARLVRSCDEGLQVIRQGEIPVLVDPEAEVRHTLRSSLPPSVPFILVDARMTKKTPELGLDVADLVIGLGPGFTAGVNCHAVIETMRGHRLGRVLWQGTAQPDTRVPEAVWGHGAERVLRAPADGVLTALVDIGEHLEPGQLVARVGEQPVCAPFAGVLRGLLYPGLRVVRGSKIGDVDPRDDASLCYLVSDKSLAVGGGVLEAILSRPELRPYLWE